MSNDMSSIRGNVGVIHQGEQIILPVGMKEEVAIEWLKRRIQDLNSPVRVREVIQGGYPVDAALAFNRALAKKYGWTQSVGTPSFWGENPPTMISVETGLGQRAEVPWGRIEIPGIVGFIDVGIVIKDGNPNLLLNGNVQKRFVADIAAIADLTREELRLNSIYRGKAIKVSFQKFDDADDFNPEVHVPAFMEPAHVGPEDLIFSQAITWDFNTSVWDPLRDRDAARRMKVPGKRVVVLSGPYGTGKTMAALATQRVCVESGVTFIYLEKTGDVREAVQFASQYSPACIFAEDVDAVLLGEERDEEKNGLINVLDGIEGKESEVTVIFSTNHPKRINKAALRPGRVHAFIALTPPDEAAAAKLILKYGAEYLAPDCQVGQIASLLKGQIPAAIREVVERAKLSLLRKPDGSLVTTQDLLLAVQSIQPQLDLLAEPIEQGTTAFQDLGDAIGIHLDNALRRPNVRRMAREAGAVARGNGTSA